jgi:hypothetical protein
MVSEMRSVKRRGTIKEMKRRRPGPTVSGEVIGCCREMSVNEK